MPGFLGGFQPSVILLPVAFRVCQAARAAARPRRLVALSVLDKGETAATCGQARKKKTPFTNKPQQKTLFRSDDK